MSAKATTIELNGKRYDTKTGKVVGAGVSIAPAVKKPVLRAATTTKQTGSIDGFSRRPTSARTKTTAHAVHKKTEKSKTLMRTAVKKPATAYRKPAAPTVAKHRRPVAHIDIDPKRISRAKSIPKNALVSKFGTAQKAVKPITSALPVRPAPADPPAALLGVHHTPDIAKHASVHQKTIQKALDNATSHKQLRTKKTTRRQHLSRKLRVSTRTVNVAAASLALLLLVGFVAYQNVPNLSMRVATARAGVNGTLPGYQPSGFGLAGPIQYQNGQIVLNYASHSDQRQFKISQKTTQWNSDTLLDNFLASDQKTYRTLQDSGKTIYIYDDDNATWVDGGVWYQIEGNAALSNDQLLRMAASM